MTRSAAFPISAAYGTGLETNSNVIGREGSSISSAPGGGTGHSHLNRGRGGFRLSQFVSQAEPRPGPGFRCRVARAGAARDRGDRRLTSADPPRTSANLQNAADAIALAAAHDMCTPDPHNCSDTTAATTTANAYAAKNNMDRMGCRPSTLLGGNTSTEGPNRRRHARNFLLRPDPRRRLEGRGRLGRIREGLARWRTRRRPRR